MSATTPDGAESQLRMVGRLQAVHDSIKTAISELPNEERHAADLLCIARDATHKALVMLWGKAPEVKS